MKIEIIKEANLKLKEKSYQLRIEFRDNFYESDYEKLLIQDLDKAWLEIGVSYFWHIGENFADGFFIDFNEGKINLEDIISTTQKTLKRYEDKIVLLKFRDTN